jgi:hypothetical protein
MLILFKNIDIAPLGLICGPLPTGCASPPFCQTRASLGASLRDDNTQYSCRYSLSGLRPAGHLPLPQWQIAIVRERKDLPKLVVEMRILGAGIKKKSCNARSDGSMVLWKVVTPASQRVLASRSRLVQNWYVNWDGCGALIRCIGGAHVRQCVLNSFSDFLQFRFARQATRHDLDNRRASMPFL